MNTRFSEHMWACHRRDGVTLVQLGEQYALVDAVHERVVVLNAAGAAVWARLGTDPGLPSRNGEFLAALRREGVLQDRPNPESPQTPVPWSADTPRVLAAVPLQVAANNSGDPFAATGW